MGLNKYEIFLKAAETGNITKTAELLHYTQAGVSHAVNAVEKAVDVLPGDTPEQLQRRVMEQAEWILLPQAAELVSKGVIA